MCLAVKNDERHLDYFFQVFAHIKWDIWKVYTWFIYGLERV